MSTEKVIQKQDASILINIGTTDTKSAGKNRTNQTGQIAILFVQYMELKMLLHHSSRLLMLLVCNIFLKGSQTLITASLNFQVIKKNLKPSSRDHLEIIKVTCTIF